ncbi:MAG: CRISPR-associated protein Cas5 [Rhodococcus sp. (in: high G+C Gram-positive bacteria)]|uniref:CRISPR-associated protein Cas5 n=1 Tax=Rhodococcus sp. TaxID=1831 RepID=UPI003BB711F6
MNTATVTFRLAGPQQAWSVQQRRAHRPTQDHPTKSGVIGLIANALGRDRSDDISDLTALQIGVRTDKPGTIETDYHTSGSGEFPLLPAEILADPALTRAAAKGLRPDRAYAAPKNIGRDSKGTLVGKRDNAILTTDEYLADAEFTIALTGHTDLVEQIAAALTAPARSLYLGRRAYPLSKPPNPLLHPHDNPAAALGATATGPTWIEEPPTREAHRNHNTHIVVDQPTRFDHRRYVGRLETRHAPKETESTSNTTDFFTPEEHP